jgi:hypothetical protein
MAHDRRLRGDPYDPQKAKRAGVQRGQMSVYCTASFFVSSRRRTKLPIFYPDFRLDYKLATLAGSEPTGTVPTTVFVEGSITETVFDLSFVM